ncbi:MAG: hypothetical protein HZA52_21370 [Planctomycetes bacterium]|nr:hypothetical protein [Planctomycetota bacterium]
MTGPRDSSAARHPDDDPRLAILRDGSPSEILGRLIENDPFGIGERALTKCNHEALLQNPERQMNDATLATACSVLAQIDRGVAAAVVDQVSARVKRVLGTDIDYPVECREWALRQLDRSTGSARSVVNAFV